MEGGGNASRRQRRVERLGARMSGVAMRQASCLCDAPLDAVLLGRQVVPAVKAETSLRTPYPSLGCPTLTATWGRTQSQL